MKSLLCVVQEFIAKAMTLPGEGEIMDMMEVADPDAVHTVRTFIRKQLAAELKEELLNTVCATLFISYVIQRISFAFLVISTSGKYKYYVSYVLHR